jgi:hypothetical protein
VSVPVATDQPSNAIPNPGSSRLAAARLSGKNPNGTAPAVGGLSSPQSRSLGIDRSGHSLAQQAKIVYAGANNTSYEQGDADLKNLAEMTEVGAKQVRRICKHIGAERCLERDEAVAEYQALTLVERKQAPEGVTAPEVAVVGVDGGRLQIFDRSAKSDATAGTERAGDSTSTDDHPDERADNGRHWREDKIGLLMTMQSEVQAVDPCPEIPANFVNPLRIMKLARELKKRVAVGEEAIKPATEADEPADGETPEEWDRPEVESKRFVATRRVWEEFGPMVATRAWEWGFYGASRKAFIGDGASNNWTMWRNHFSSFTPVLDFIHALSYVFASATAGRPFGEGWTCYVRWIEWVWKGEVEQVVSELVRRREELGLPGEGESSGNPREVVSRALEYLRNNESRMKYAEYRRAGLPLTSSYVESAVKQFNYRVKGTEKFWDEDGAEQMLQLRADFLSDDQPLDGFWKRREANESGQRRYRKVA